jgi:hypothetical protein
MITLCKKCGISWAALWSVEIGSEDQLEICPECKTDAFLEASDDFISFICCPISGRIINPATGEELIRTVASSYPSAPRSAPKYSREEFIKRREARELEAILAYRSSGNPGDYFSTFKKPL